jgi:hypothetical protein
MHVDIRGRGCPLRLELADLNMQNVDFGVTMGGEPVSRMVRLVNRSLRAVNFELADEKQTSQDAGELQKRNVSWSPMHRTTLRPKETMDIDLRFTPMYRVAPFRLPLYARCDHGTEIRLLQIAGTCHAIEMRLSEHSVFFGEVVLGSQAVRPVRLHNFGDIGAKFRFELPPRFRSVFSISPMEGFVRPQEELPLRVAFHPAAERVAEFKRAEEMQASRRGKKIDKDVDGMGLTITCRDIRCHLDGHAPLMLEATGKCITQPGETKTLEFCTEVRQQEVKSFEVNNPTDHDWKVQPQVTTAQPAGANFWSCAREVVIPAGKSAVVELAYMPLVMTDQTCGE